ncbi:MAG: serine/threonine protein phosphatase [Deltaproteobacteria bacterium]|nr:serine/threonine protein phosphatase [Deltaproteobacteria bacterium]
MARYVIGDIHGCPEELARLLEALPLQPADRIVFLGDYVDRGPDSSGVISHLIEWQERAPQELIFLKGNHEDMFLSYLGLGGNYGDMFLFNGGGATLASYGAARRVESREEILARIPPGHLEFLENLRLYYLMEPFLCVHAGIHPARPLAQQVEEELLWIRDEFILNRHPLPYTVLFGHTPQREAFFHLPYKVGLDTGLVYGNKLSCLEVEEKVLFQIGRGQRQVHRIGVKDRWEQIPHAPVA